MPSKKYVRNNYSSSRKRIIVICPCCGKGPSSYILWRGRGKPKKLCYPCRVKR